VVVLAYFNIDFEHFGQIGEQSRIGSLEGYKKKNEKKNKGLYF